MIDKVLVIKNILYKNYFLKLGKEKLLVIIFFSISILTWSNKIIGGPTIRYMVLTLLGAFFTLFVDFIMLKETNIQYKFSKIGLFWLLVGVGMAASAIVHCIDNLLLAFLYLVIFPLSWFIFVRMDESDKSLFYYSIAQGITLSYLLFFIISLIFAPITRYNYTGIFNNSNAHSQFLTVVFACAMFLLFKYNKKRYYLYVASIIMMLIICRSRTGLLSAVFIMSIWVFGFLYNNGFRKGLTILLKRIVLISLLVGILLAFFFTVNRVAIHTVQQKICLNAYEELMKLRGQHITDKLNFTDLEAGIETRIGINGRDVNEYSAGRVAIWKEYINELNWSGHPSDNGDFSKTHFTAHNGFIQIAYDYGIINGVMYLICILILCWKMLLNTMKHCNENLLFSLTIAVGSGVTFMFASSVFPFAYLPSLVFCFMIYEGGIVVTNEQYSK